MNDIGVVKTHYLSLSDMKVDEIVLESGARLGPLVVAYETYGTLHEEGNNAILICHALSGDAHAAGYHERIGHKEGWWHNAIGPGKAFDTDKYFVVCSNVLGGCQGTTGPSSVDPKTGKPYGIRFPVITIGDMVHVQWYLMKYLGISRWLAVAGGSMGGMQTLEWVLKYPEHVHSALVIASTGRLSPQSIAFNAVGRNAIISDPHWNNGDYYGKSLPEKGLAIARMIGHITYLSEDSMEKKFGRKLQNKEAFSFDFSTEFAVESYLHYQGQKFVERFDANTYLYVTKAMDYFDIAAKYGKGSLKQSLSHVKARMLLLSFSSDWLFPPSQTQELVDALVANHKDVTYFNIESSYGHDAFLLEVEKETAIIQRFLEASYRLWKEGR
ncbi:MAG: homoserine O-acetyltransferase [Brevinematales bacterium]|nr:homoserine O-acetyltransferase [Brevinematales bacterium]